MTVTDPSEDAEPDQANEDVAIDPVTAWRDPGFDVAWRILRDRQQAAMVIEDVLASMNPADDAEIGPTVLVRARRTALGRAEHDDDPQGGSGPDTGLVFVDDVAAGRDPFTETELALAATEAMGAADASLVDLHIRFRVPAAALAEDLGTDPDEAAARLRRLAGRLEGVLGAWVLWNGGFPKCDVLAEQITRPGLTWSPRAARHIARHAVGCDQCRRTLHDEGITVERFAAAPILRAPTAPPRRATRADDADPTAAAPGEHEPELAGPTAEEVAMPLEDDHMADEPHGETDDEWRLDDWGDEDGEGDEGDEPGISRRFAVALLALLIVVAVVLAYVLITAPEAGGN